MKLKTSTYNQFQSLCWTEDNRLQAVKDNKMGAYYNYDAAGERNLKLTGGIINVTQNGQSVYAPVFDQQTLYASALVTVNDKGYTKHYFEEGKRICSKIGSGELKNVFDPVPKIEKSYEEQRDIQVEGIHTTYSQCMDISPYIKNGNLYENIINKYTTQVNSGEPIFYYHSDHLGSASYITDSSGIQTQQLVYLPFGEDWVDMKYNTSQYDTPYKFNGKEKDEETGYNYYGARYYYDWASIWLSVDPMSDKYPHLTSYNYCANNPIMLVDPDGRNIDEFRINIDNGKIEEVSNAGGKEFDVFNITNNKGEAINTYVFDKNDKGLINMEDNQYGINTHGQSGIYMNPKAVAAILGVLNDVGFNDISLGNFSKSDGTSPSPSVSHKNGKNGDIRPLRTDYSGKPCTVYDSKFDKNRNTKLVSSLNKFGWKSILSHYDKKGYITKGTIDFKNHADHFHIQGFNPNVSRSKNYTIWPD